MYTVTSSNKTFNPKFELINARNANQQKHRNNQTIKLFVFIIQLSFLKKKGVTMKEVTFGLKSKINDDIVKLNSVKKIQYFINSNIKYKIHRNLNKDNRKEVI